MKLTKTNNKITIEIDPDEAMTIESKDRTYGGKSTHIWICVKKVD